MFNVGDKVVLISIDMQGWAEKDELIVGDTYTVREAEENRIRTSEGIERYWIDENNFKLHSALLSPIQEALGMYAAIKSSDDMVQEARSGAYNTLANYIDSMSAVDVEFVRNTCNANEDEYMLAHHNTDEYKKGNGSWNKSKVFDTAYKTAKSTLLKAIEHGVDIVDEDGVVKGKSRLAKETKSNQAIPSLDSDYTHAMECARDFIKAYGSLTAKDKVLVHDYMDSCIN